MRRVGFAGVVLVAAAFAAPAPAQTPTGDPRPETVRADPLTAADPAGGLPWGIRHYRTTTGLACVEAGRRSGNAIGTVDDSGTFTETAAGSGHWICGGLPTSPPRGIGSTLGYLDRSGTPVSCDPFPPRGEQGCDPSRTRTIAILSTGPSLAAATVWRGRSARRVVVPRGGSAMLVVLGGIVRSVDVRLSFRGGCSRRARKVLLGYHDARRAGCRVVIPIHLGRP